MDVKIVVAVISAAVAIFGWFVTSVIAIVVARRDRTDKIIDIQRALAAEIRAFIESSGTMSETIEQAKTRAEEEFSKYPAKDGFTPFVPRQNRSTVYHAVLPELHLLPGVTIEAVVLFYQTILSIELMAEDMRSQDFRDMPEDRRRRMLLGYLQLYEQAIAFGTSAERVLDREINRMDRARLVL